MIREKKIEDVKDDEEDIQEEIYGEEDDNYESEFNEKSTNYFLRYVKPWVEFNPTGLKPKHIYTIEIHRCKFTAELAELS